MKSGIILIDKDIGMTSREVDNRIGRLFSTRKVGHLGTLDPFASGLLLIAINGGTKFLPYLPDTKKTYEATLLLGEKTSSGDKDGEVIKRREIPSLSEEKVNEALSSFLGESYQLPPMSSAIKINGTPLYKLAHKGIEIERKKRPINVYAIELLSLEKDRISFCVTVSSGTYIRTLGEDIAAKLGSIGHLISLRRTAIGNISVSRAIKLDEAKEDEILDPTPFLDYEQLEVEEDMVKSIRNGKAIELGEGHQDKLVLTYEKKAVAIYIRKEGNLYKAERGLFIDEENRL